ncbi:hypothetical protein OC842_007043, partial [Tilletia horrida]
MSQSAATAASTAARPNEPDPGPPTDDSALLDVVKAALATQQPTVGAAIAHVKSGLSNSFRSPTAITA